jgi:hypothetical protein
MMAGLRRLQLPCKLFLLDARTPSGIFARSKIREVANAGMGRDVVLCVLVRTSPTK